MNPATPGTILILAACILLTLITCSTPIIKSISFLSATIGGSGNQAHNTINLGCLGYCLGSSCVGPTIGYSFDPTQLLGIATSVDGISINTSKYSTALIKGLTYTLVLHPIALGACVLTLIFGLLAHCGDMSLRCMNSFFSSIASVITLIAVACDFALFIIAQKRINAISGASASLGSALWMTLIAWILIILSSFSFCCSCCGSSGGGRKHKNKGDAYDDDAWKGNRGGMSHADHMRMDAIDAEADRKRRNNLPKFATYETEHVESLPLTHDYEGAGQQARFADTSTNGGHGYPNQFGYSEGHTPASELDAYPHAYGQAMMPSSTYPQHMNSYIPGVGPGAPRTVPAATAYYDNSSSSIPSTYPIEQGYGDDGSVYSHGAYRAPSLSSNYSRGQGGGNNYYNAQGAPPVPALPNSYAEPMYQQRQESYQGHPLEYSERSQHSNNESPYDAVKQATLAASRLRMSPNVANQHEFDYSSSSNNRNANSHRGDDDSFGLSVLQAGAASKAMSSNFNSNRHEQDDQITSPIEYNHENRLERTIGSSSRSRPLPTAPSGGSLGQPPEYSSDSENDAYGGMSSRDFAPVSSHTTYPREKH